MGFPRFLVLALMTGALVAAGCGNQRREQFDVTPDASSEKVPLRVPRAGLRLELPKNVKVRRAEPPGVFFGSVGESVISAFAYRRRESLPGTDAELDKALERLERATKNRDPSYALRDSRTLEVNGSRATELVGDQAIQNKNLRTRSVHVYEGEAEYVVELLSPPEEFDRLDRDLFEPMIDSLRVTGTVRRAN